MRPLHRNLSVAAAGAALIGWLFWQFGPVQAVVAVAHLSDPAKLATLGERGANPRLNKIVYWLHDAGRRGLSPAVTIQCAQLINWTREPRASLVKESLLRNMDIADRLGLFTSSNLDHLRHGRAAVITKGPYTGSTVEIDHIVP